MGRKKKNKSQSGSSSSDAATDQELLTESEVDEMEVLLLSPKAQQYSEYPSPSDHQQTTSQDSDVIQCSQEVIVSDLIGLDKPIQPTSVNHTLNDSFCHHIPNNQEMAEMLTHFDESQSRQLNKRSLYTISGSDHSDENTENVNKGARKKIMRQEGASLDFQRNEEFPPLIAAQHQVSKNYYETVLENKLIRPNKPPHYYSNTANIPKSGSEIMPL